MESSCYRLGMTILLANDDGYQAEGIQVLLRVLEEAGHEVWMAAPDGERSAKSHSMTLGEDIVARKIGENRWILNGQPGDCVLYGLKGGLFPRTPDMVVTGINRGYNISTDVCYSGTIGAAEEATLCGVPAIALSCQGRPYLRPGPSRVVPFSLWCFKLCERERAGRHGWKKLGAGRAVPSGLQRCGREDQRIRHADVRPSGRPLRKFGSPALQGGGNPRAEGSGRQRS